MTLPLTTSINALDHTPEAQRLEGFLPDVLSGEMNDEQALAGWLGFVSLRNQQTYRSYRAEVTRFRVFLEQVHLTPAQQAQSHGAEFLLRDATELDVLHYEAHLLGRYRTGASAPALRVRREILNRHGRAEQPFLKAAKAAPASQAQFQIDEPLQLKASSANQALSILHALYEYFIRPDPRTKASYVGANPVKRIKTSMNRSQRQTNRNFPIEAITAMMQTLSLASKARPSEQAVGTSTLTYELQIARQRWIVALLFGLWGRRAEIAGLRMCDFSYDGVRWTVRVSRKGGKEQSLPAASWVIKELMRYRESLGLSALPHRDDLSPAIGRLRRRECRDGRESAGIAARGEQATISADTVYREVTACAHRAAKAINDGLVLCDLDTVERQRVAGLLVEITPHWFRHSGASMAINNGVMSLENASKMLGHSSTTITAEMYYHPDQGQIEEGMQQLGAGTFG